MSGDIQFRVNRSWFSAVQAGVSAKRIFGDFLAFFADHPNFHIISYGTGKVQTGVTVPTTWKAWADSDGSGVPPFADNSWFVVEAQKASAALNGDGSRKWQAKFQVTTTTAFDDCNVANIDYGSEGEFQILAFRFSPDGGWIGAGTLDFGGGVVASLNMLIADFDWPSEYNYYLHILGDDDTVLWVGHSRLVGNPIPYYPNQKFGYMGELVRRNSNHTKPELAMAQHLYHTGGRVLAKGDGEDATVIFSNDQMTVPSFSLGADGTSVTQHRVFIAHKDNTASGDMLFNAGPDPWSGEDEFLTIPIGQNHQEHQSVLGHLRLIELAGNYIIEGNLFGDGTRLSVSYNTAVRGGLAIAWPGSGVGPIF